MKRVLVALSLAALIAPAHAGESKPAPPAVEALAACAPGAPFDACADGLKAAGVSFDPPRPGNGHREINLALRAPWELVEVSTEAGAGGRITRVRFQAKMKPGAARKQVLAWLDEHLKTLHRRDAAGNLGCGAGAGGPAWFSTEAQATERQPEVQFAIDQFKTIKGPNGRPMSAVVVDTANEMEHLCFRLPRKKEGAYEDAAPLAAQVAEFVRASPAKVRPLLSLSRK